jgi:hypothetical protein
VTVSNPINFFHRIVLAAWLGSLWVVAAPNSVPVAPVKEDLPATPPVKEVKPPAPPVKEVKPSVPAVKEVKPPAPHPEKVPANPAPAPVAPKQAPAAPPESGVPDNAAPADPDDEAAAENIDAETAAVAKPVSPDPVRIYGWREHVIVKGVAEKLQAKLDTGALTSSIHAEDKELFERDGRKWVRFIVTDPTLKKPTRTRIEAPLVRIAKIKEPGGESVSREVVQLGFQLGERKLRGEFTLNNRSNMLAPILIGRNMIKTLGWVDPGRTHLADQKIFR